MTGPRQCLILVVLVSAAGCAERAPAPAPLPPAESSRTAVLDFRIGGELTDGVAFAAAPEGPGDDPELGAAIARELGARLADAGVGVVDADVVSGALSLVDSSTYDPALAGRVGARLGANLAVIGALARYREREGNAWAVQAPASVAYQAALVRVADGAVVTVHRFDYTQRALTENLLEVGKFIEAGGRWLTREDILHGALRQTAAHLAAAVRGERPPSSLPVRLPGR
jgi:hypothetical protein